MLPGKTLSDDNQFINLLVKNLDPDIKVLHFNWFNAFFRCFDVLHIHWQERLYRGRNPLKSRIKQILLVFLFFRLKVHNTKVLWTVHNLSPHEKLNKVEYIFETLFLKLVDIRVFMQPISQETQTDYFIPHGIYDSSEDPPPYVEKHLEITRLICAGYLRPSKNLERLIRMLPENDFVSLLIVGEPVSKNYGLELKELCRSKVNIELRLGRVSQEELQELYKTADFAIVPYINTYNSGAALFALSIPIPLLASKSESMLNLQMEVGPYWMQLFRNDFDSYDIAAAIKKLRSLAYLRSEKPVFSDDRQWKKIGEKYSSLYRSGKRK